mmetsp:Transcript_26315/g.54815  ORF Transcript_26315/g.54815 Transcript_26315/m.54815 type:complete len:501 (+) Transcript_26315:80-1582(+)
MESAPIKQGWLYKDRYLSLLPDSHNYFVLTKSGFRYYSEKGGSSTDHEFLRGTIQFDDMVDVSKGEGAHFNIVTWYRCYELRAETGAEAEEWVKAISDTRKHHSHDDALDRRSSTHRSLESKPWLVDEVWLDESDPLPIYMHANVGSELKGEHTIHVKLADGHVFTVEGVEVDGESKEVAVAETRTLSASLVKRDVEQARGQKAPLGDSLHPAFAVVLTLLAVEYFPEIFAKAAGKIALTLAAFLLGHFVLPVFTAIGKEKKGSAIKGGVEIVLKAEELMTRPKALSTRRQSGQKMPRRRPIYERRLSFQDAQRKGSRNILVEGIPSVDPAKPPVEGEKSVALVSDVPENVSDRVNFSGHFVLDLGASDNPTEMLTAMGVPWIARKAISKTARTLIIDQDGDDWKETIVAPMITKNMAMKLDGTPSVEISPVDKSTVTSVTTFSEDGKKVVSKNSFGDASNKSQVISRELIDNGDVYVVENTLTMGDKVIHTRSCFNRQK